MYSCHQAEEAILVSDQTDINKLQVSTDFNYNTVRDVSIIIAGKDKSGSNLRMENIEIYDQLPSEGGHQIAQGSTSATGSFTMSYALPTYLKEIVVVSHFIGVLDTVYVPVINSKASYIFQPVTEVTDRSGRENANRNARITSSDFKLMGTFNNKGVPNYLEPVNDPIDGQFLNDISATLPENRPVPVYNPGYLVQDNTTDIKLSAEADIWITFVHEGAGWRNVLGYYSYPLSNPPKTANEIKEKIIIFPNVSYTFGGGGLVAGNKVHLGRFPAGTGIGWFLVSDGWNGTSVGNGHYTIYSNSSFNPEPSAAIRQHNVLIDDTRRKKILLGFEDVRRDNTPISCDQDFNDAIFFVTASPYTAVLTEKMPDIKQTAPDQDQDGVADAYDQYPNDMSKAYNTYAPAVNSFGTLAFEDLWPSTGDYDMNDLVVKYNYMLATNSENKVVEMKARFLISAVGASFHNGFGVQLPVSPAKVANVSGMKLLHNYISLDANNVESGQAKATFIVFDDAFDHIPSVPGTYNTLQQQPVLYSDTITIALTFTTPLHFSELQTAPYNPFIIIRRNRNHEVHLPGKEPTSKASQAFFGTSSDNTNPSRNIYYKTNKNLPFALHMATEFEYPAEYNSISNAYLKFGSWAQSGGVNYTDWYLPIQNYRNEGKIYKK